MNENQAELTPRGAEKTRKYGGAPTQQGLELFAKLALSGDHLRIAGVLVGSGTVPDDVYIGDMTQLVEPVGIGTCSEPIRNGASVNMTVECRSDLNKELTDGMTIREFLIQAWDGEEKVTIYYGCLADYPQYVAPWEEGYLDVRRYPVSIRLAPSVKVDLDDSLPGVVMTIDDIKDYCISTLLPQLLTASQNQIVNHNQAEDAHPALRESIRKAQQTADDAASAAALAQWTADSAVQAAERNSGGRTLNFEPEDWTDGALRVPQAVHGIQPGQGTCIGTLHQRVDRTALDYQEQTAAQGHTSITNAVKAALNANSSAPGTYPAAEDGHIQLTWNQVQCYILEGTLLSADARRPKRRKRDSTGRTEILQGSWRRLLWTRCSPPPICPPWVGRQPD